jgi:hypothetical protein
MKAKEYEVLRRCVDEGVAYGLTRAYKHTSTPEEETIKGAIEQAVMDAISEWFTFDGDDDSLGDNPE